MKENLGLSPPDLELLTGSLNVIINSAASVNFVERLDKAIRINVYGALNTQALAK